MTDTDANSDETALRRFYHNNCGDTLSHSNVTAILMAWTYDVLSWTIFSFV